MPGITVDVVRSCYPGTHARAETSRPDACEAVTPRQTLLARRGPLVTAGPARRLRPRIRSRRAALAPRGSRCVERVEPSHHEAPCSTGHPRRRSCAGREGAEPARCSSPTHGRAGGGCVRTLRHRAFCLRLRGTRRVRDTHRPGRARCGFTVPIGTYP